MSGQKRKAAKPDVRKSKDSKREKSSAKVDKKEPSASHGSRNLPTSSILLEEERAFPRGGDTGLTPLERKQIQIKADRDVLFEETGQKRPPVQQDDDDFDQDVDILEAEQPVLKKRKKSNPIKKENAPQKEARVRVESLKTKNMLQGSLVLGQISKVTDHDLVLDLPNNLSGIVPITDISVQLNTKLEAALEDENKEHVDSSNDEEDLVDLHHYFSIGQYLRASTKTATESTIEQPSTKERKRIELSVDPRQANRGISKSDISTNAMIQASVASVEDHGIVMDLGLADGDVKGFMAKKDVPSGVDLSAIKFGMVFLCIVTGLSSNGKVVKLSADSTKSGEISKTHVLAQAPTINSFLPGAAVEVMITETTLSSVTGIVMGMIDVTADSVHSDAGPRRVEVDAKYRVGSKHKARIIFALAGAEKPCLGVSFLDHVLHFDQTVIADDANPDRLLRTLPMSHTIDSAEVTNASAGLGLYLDVGIESTPAFVHLSRVSDDRLDRIDKIDGPYKIGSRHRARIVGYNAMDKLYLASMRRSVLDQPFLRVEDVPIGGRVKGTIRELKYGANGINGVIVDLADGLSGLVPETHMADIRLEYPERKFKKGLSVSARVLSTDSEKRQIRLSLKKSLLNSELPAWTNYNDVAAGDESIGTIVNLTSKGAFLQFFGETRAFLPVSEFSDAFVEDATKHFRIGQTLTVRAMSIDSGNRRLTVSSRPQRQEEASASAFDKLRYGDIVHGLITAKSEEDFSVTLDDTGLAASLSFKHLTDGSLSEDQAAAGKLRVGRHMKDMVIVDLFHKNKSIVLAKRPKLLKAAKAGKLITSLDQALVGETAVGYIHNITETGVFVRFTGILTALLPRSQISDENHKIPNFGLMTGQSIESRVLAVHPEENKFTLTMKEHRPVPAPTPAPKEPERDQPAQVLVNPVDSSLTTVDHVSPGKTIKVRITSVKDTQLNVQVADNVQGRIDVSEAFQDFRDIADLKQPLRQFQKHQTLDVRVIGMHDARNHRFLPITHRSGRVPVFELSTRLEDSATIMSLDQIKQNAFYTAFVNNVASSCLWVNLSPNVRGRIERMDVSEDISICNELDKHFTVGAALRVWAKKIDLGSGRLDLCAKSQSSATKELELEHLTTGIILPGRVTKIEEHRLLVHLSDHVMGVVPLTELVDDYDEASTRKFQKHEMVRVCVVDVDRPNKRVVLSSRPSKVLSSSLPVTDPSVLSVNQLKKGDVVRGFINQVANIGLFVLIGPQVKAMVPVSELFDGYVEDWKKNFRVDQLVTGRIIELDTGTHRIHLSLKKSAIDPGYEVPLQFSDMKKGQVVTGRIRKVEDFGAFVVVDNSQNVSGLCHRSQMADRRVDDARKLYNEDDRVKALVTEVDMKKRRISFSLKASHFASEDKENVKLSEDRMTGDRAKDSSSVEELGSVDDDSNSDSGVSLTLSPQLSLKASSANTNSSKLPIDPSSDSDADSGLDAGGFNWNPTAVKRSPSILSDDEPTSAPKKKKRKSDPYEEKDHTADVANFGPRSATDFERLLLTDRDDPALWVRYMSFHVDAGDIARAREIAERATRSIGITRDQEKLEVWTAWLNLELAFNDDTDKDETLFENDPTETSTDTPIARLPIPQRAKDVFSRACAVHDRAELTQRLIRSLVRFGKLNAATDLYASMSRDREFTALPAFWIRYATFLMRDAIPPQPSAARALVPRAMQSLPEREHPNLLSRFAALEFQLRPHDTRNTAGDPERGRTLFTELLSLYPKRYDFADVWLSLEFSLLAEIARADTEGKSLQEQRVRDLFERQVADAAPRMKKKRAQGVFDRWKDFEEGIEGKGGAEKMRRVERVKGKEGRYFEVRLGRDH